MLQKVLVCGLLSFVLVCRPVNINELYVFDKQLNINIYLKNPALFDIRKDIMGFWLALILFTAELHVMTSHQFLCVRVVFRLYGLLAS